MALVKCSECGGAVSTAAAACPHCGHPMAGSDPARKPLSTTGANTSARIKRRSSFLGGGCALQGLGLVSLVLAAVTFLTVIGPIVFGVLGLWLLAYGSAKSTWLDCSACGGKVSNSRVKTCPHCNASFP